MLCLVVAASMQTTPLIQRLDSLAQARDGKGLLSYLADPVAGRSPFAPIVENGSYSVGAFGWHALPLEAPDGSKLVVFATRMTSEDVGEQVFRVAPGDKLRKLPEADDLGVHVHHASLSIDFDPPAKTAKIVAKVSFERFDRAGSWFVVRMSPNYVVSSVKDADGKDVKFAEAGGVVAMPTPSAAKFEYEIAYSGVVDQPEYAGAITDREAMLTNDYWYPMIARLPATFDVTVRTQSSWSVVAQGDMVSDTVEGSVRTTKYDMHVPVTYWSLDAGPFHRVDKPFPNIPMYAVAVDLTEDRLEDQPEYYRPIMDFYSKSFGTYPFKKWGCVVSRLYGGGALEAYSFCTWGGGAPGEDAHEAAHTWFGGMVDNTYLKSFWNESFANYCQGLYQREGPVGNVDEKRLAFVSDAAAQSAYNGGTLVDSGVESGSVGGALGYGKGAQVLQMLEREIGSDKMQATLRGWVADQPKGVPGEWEDYEREVGKVVGPGLTWFFDEWFRRPGYVDFNVSEVKWADGKVTGKLTFASLPYKIDCEAMLQFADGSRRFAKFDTTAHPNGDAYDIEIPCADKPAIVSIDPWRAIVRNIHRDEVPINLSGFIASATRFTDPKHAEYLKTTRSASNAASLPSNFDGAFIVGNPETLPAMAGLCAKAGFVVSGSKLAYDGTTIDLNQGAAMAIVDLGGGKRCCIGLGQVKHRPSTGASWLALTDDYGRFLRGKSEPKTSGFLTYRLN